MANRMIHTPSYLSTAADIGLYWTGAGAACSVSSGWYLGTTNSAANNLMAKTFDSQSGWTVGFRFKYSGVADATPMTLVRFLDGVTTHLEFDFTASTGLWRVTRNGTLLLTGTTVLSQNTEYYVEIQCTIADSGGVAILKVDGTADGVINSSSLDTRNGANASANIVQMQLFSGSSRIVPQYKDIYINDNNGANDITFWGPMTVASLVPSSAGNKAQWTPLSSTNVSNVDDTVVDGDTTYNSTATNGNIDSFVATDTGYSAGTVLGVEWASEVRRLDASSTARVAPVFRIGGTDYVGSDIAFSTTYTIQTQRYRQSPATSSAWTVSELDGAEVGYKRSAA